MNADRYSVASDGKHEIYEFLSEGPNGAIKKIIFYEEIENNIFNLGFGDWDKNTQQIDYKARSNNNDRNRVLATIASTVIDFMKYHPVATLVAIGSTPGRTRLYQISITHNWYAISQLFEIKGLYKEKWQPFERGKNYDAFMLKAKKYL